jgi:outer membrane protein assembly factor BamB
MLKRLALLSMVSMSLAAGPLAAPANVAGQWNISLELGSITGRPTIELKQDGEKLTGTYRGRYGASPLEGEVKENQIGFTVTMNAEGQQTSGYFSGVVDGDTMNGAVEFEGAGEGTWSATRARKAAAPAADWPHWRGPSASGVAPDRTLPTRWSARENIAWRAPLAGVGVSSPIVSGDLVFVTSQIGTGIRRQGNHPRLVQGSDAAAQGERPISAPQAAADAETTVFVLEAFARASGKRVWERRIEAEGTLTPVHDKHNLASPSPVTDGTLVYAWFGTGQLAALTRDGRVAWQRHLGKEISPYDIQWGHSSSPVLHGDLLILLSDHASASYLLALDKKTGKERWKADRGKGRSSYSTPLILEGPSGFELVVNSNERLDAYDPQTGDLLWHTGESNRFPVPSPVFAGGVIYASRGYRSGPYMALRPGGRGDITATHTVWRIATGAPYVSSLLFYDGVVYMANDVGVLTASDAATGERLWQQRVEGVFSASPVAGAGHVYFVSENGDTIVVKAGRPPQVVQRNALGERTVASPAIANGHLFIRTDNHLFCIGASATPPS